MGCSSLMIQGFEKQGRYSVGVAHQYTGTVGKLTNCQVTVIGHYAERTLAWPVATRLYLPQAWAEDATRRQQAHVPADVTFQTKAEIALALLDEANACGVRHACVTCDADYGDNPNFLNGLEERGERHVVAGRANFSVTLGRGPESPVRRAGGVVGVQALPDGRNIAWGAGGTGWRGAEILAARVSPGRGGGA